MRPKIAKMRPKRTKMRPKRAKMRPKRGWDMWILGRDTWMMTRSAEEAHATVKAKSGGPISSGVPLRRGEATKAPQRRPKRHISHGRWSRVGPKRGPSVVRDAARAQKRAREKRPFRVGGV